MNGMPQAAVIFLSSEAMKQRVIRNLNDFHEIFIGRNSGNDEAMAGQSLFELAVELISMTMALGNDRRIIGAIRQRAQLQIRRVSAQAHGPADGVNAEK